MLHLALRVLLLSALTVSAAPSEACRTFLTPAERVAFGYERKVIAAVAIVRIAAASYVGPRRGDAHPWRASAVVESVSGGYAGKLVSFSRGNGSAACDDAHPVPQAGEQWAIYFWKRPGGDYAVWQSYPLSIAMSADSRLKTLIARQPHQVLPVDGPVVPIGHKPDFRLPHGEAFQLDTSSDAYPPTAELTQRSGGRSADDGFLDMLMAGDGTTGRPRDRKVVTFGLLQLDALTVSGAEGGFTTYYRLPDSTGKAATLVCQVRSKRGLDEGVGEATDWCLRQLSKVANR